MTTTEAAAQTTAQRVAFLQGIASSARFCADSYPTMRSLLPQGVEGIDIPCVWESCERSRRRMWLRLRHLMPELARDCCDVCKPRWHIDRRDNVDWVRAIAELRRIEVEATDLASVVELQKPSAASVSATPDPDEPKSFSLVHPPADDGSKLRPSRLRAWQARERALEHACELNGATDAAVYKWLKENDTHPSYTLPKRCSAFERYLREVRTQRRQCSATSPRAGREHGSSIVRLAES